MINNFGKIMSKSNYFLHKELKKTFIFSDLSIRFAIATNLFF